jgi:hypothetical protein
VVAATSVLAYSFVTLLTDPVFVADTPDMALSALGRLLGQYCNYLEPGHLLWRPTGAVMLDAFDTMQAGAATETVLRASEVQLGWFAWVSGLIAIVGCGVWLHRKLDHVAAALFGVAVVLFSKAFINYAQVGASYLPALAFLVLAVILLTEDGAPPLWSAIAGAFLGLSVLFWGAFIVALPAALAAPFIFGRDIRRGLRTAVWASVGGAVVAAGAALWVSRSLGIGASELAAWAGTADHGIATGGFPRAVLGFARSYLETGDYGRLVKRFLVGDAVDPVPMRALFGFPMLGIVGFYLGMLFMLVLAYRHRLGGRTLAFFACNAIPVVAFAIFWQGGDLERYLPLVPGVALLSATAFASASFTPRLLLGLWVVMMVIPNALALGLPAVSAERDRLRLTTRAFEAQDRPLLVFSHWQDERVQFYRNYPPGAEPLAYRPYELLTPGNNSVLDWRARVARRIMGSWDAGTRVLISERLMANSPRPEWAWVEGDDERVRWRDLHDFFRRFTYAGPAAGSVPGDGFVQLDPTPANRALVEPFRLPSLSATESQCIIPPVIPGLRANAAVR